MATGDAIYSDGSEVVLEAAGASTAVSDDAYYECDSDDLQPADVDGKPFGRFEFSTAAGGFSAAPTAGAVIEVYEQRINSDGNDSPDVDANFQEYFIGSFIVDPTDTEQHFVDVFPINKTGGKYWIHWVDGGAGTASISAGWELRVTPTTYGPEA